MSTTVLAPSGLEISANTDTGESAESMLETLSTQKNDKKPRVLVNKGQKVKDDGGDDKDETSQAASTLGKKGGEAAAAKRKADAKGKDAGKDAKPAAAKDSAQAGKADGGADDEADTEAGAATQGKDKKGNPRHDPEARIAVLAREKREAEDRARAAEDRHRQTEQRLANLERERSAPAAGQRREAPAAASADDPEPQEADYENYADYVRATASHAARAVHREADQRRAEEGRHAERARHIETRLDSFTGRIAKAAEADESFLERTADLAKSLQPSFTRHQGQPLGPIHVISDEIIKSDHSADLMLHFAENPDQFQRIAALRTPAEIQRAVAKIEGYLERDRSDAVIADTSSGREVSRAGSPFRSVNGSPHAAEPDLSSPQPFDSHMAKKKRAQQ